MRGSGTYVIRIGTIAVDTLFISQDNQLVQTLRCELICAHIVGPRETKTLSGRAV